MVGAGCGGCPCRWWGLGAVGVRVGGRKLGDVGVRLGAALDQSVVGSLGAVSAAFL